MSRSGSSARPSIDPAQLLGSDRVIALYINETRPFMAALLTNDTFDSYLLREATITTFCTYTLDGSWQKAYFADPADTAEPSGGSTASDEAPQSPPYAPWELLRPHVFDLIKGRHTPLAMRFVFQSPADLTASLLEEAGLGALTDTVYGLYLNLKFDEGRILITTGSAQKAFPPNLLIDHAWDEAVSRFLTEHGLDYEKV